MATVAKRHTRSRKASHAADRGHDVPHVTFSHVIVRVLIVPVSGSGDGGVDR